MIIRIDNTKGYNRPVFDLKEIKEEIYQIAQNRKIAYDEISWKGSQVENNIESCLTGTIAEFAAAAYLKQFYNRIKTDELDHYLTSTKHYEAVADVMVCEAQGISLIEIKGTQKQHPQNMVTPSDAKKYANRNVSFIVFVEVNILMMTATINGMVEPEIAISSGVKVKTARENLDCTDCMWQPVIIDNGIQWI